MVLIQESKWDPIPSFKFIVSYTVHLQHKEIFHKGSKVESVKCGGGKTSELLCNKLCRINTGMVEDSVTHSCVRALNHTTDLLCDNLTVENIAWWFVAYQLICLISSPLGWGHVWENSIGLIYVRITTKRIWSWILSFSKGPLILTLHCVALSHCTLSTVIVV